MRNGLQTCGLHRRRLGSGKISTDFSNPGSRKSPTGWAPFAVPRSLAATRIHELVAKAQLAARAGGQPISQRSRNSALGDLAGDGHAWWGLCVEHWPARRSSCRYSAAVPGAYGRGLGATSTRKCATGPSDGETLEKIGKEICDWADTRSDTLVQRQVLSAQQELISDRVRQLGRRQGGRQARNRSTRSLARCAWPARSSLGAAVRTGRGLEYPHAQTVQ